VLLSSIRRRGLLDDAAVGGKWSAAAHSTHERKPGLAKVHFCDGHHILVASGVAFCNPDAGAESTPRGPGGNYGPRNLGFSLRSGREYRTGDRCMDLPDGNGIKGYGSRTIISRNSAAPVPEHTYVAGAVVIPAKSDSLICLRH
jgi:hypothetical protein